MRITFLGQAGLFVETKGVSILCDPWFNPSFFGSWFPFPANDGIDPEVIGHPTYLYVSHLHHDHFDSRFLHEHVDKNATVLLPAYPLDDLEKALRALGFDRFVKTVDLEPFRAGPLTLMIHALVAPTDGPIGDSALVIDDGDVRVLNMNDSRPLDPDRLLANGPLDAAFLQFSGAIWYPMIYDYPDNAQQVLGHKKRVAQLARAFRYIEVLDPAFVVPSAGPPCFLDDDLFELNDLHGDEWNTFPDQPTFLDYIAERGRDGGRLMIPGTVAEVAPGRFDVRHPVDPATIFDDKHSYLEAYQARKRPVIEAERAAWLGSRVDLLAELQAWWGPLLEQADMICAGINQPVLLDAGDERLVIDFAERVVRRPADGEDPRYQFFIDRELVDHLVREHVEDWVNELFLSMRFRARRRGPYNDYLYTWFKCLNVERLQYAEGFYAERGPTQGTFELAGYNVQRRCPHMKSDLTRFASVADGVMTCALHGWQWELSTGRCMTSDGHPLYARPIEEGPAPAATRGDDGGERLVADGQGAAAARVS
ncbi:MAG: MBL fold metallo-hydrolase [Chloroflexi bacterium]|nr:MBL fold metallo-hydrolase [Chloroflexota bacterium]